MEKEPTIAEQMETLLASIKKLNAALLESKEELVEKATLDMAIEFTRFIVLSCPEKMNKLPEYVAAQDAKLKVNPHGQGFDMSDDSGGHWEYKQAAYISKKPKKSSNKAGYAHFIWKYPVEVDNESNADYTTRILEEVKELTNGGGIKFTISSSNPQIRREYKFSDAFIQAYFARVTEKKMQACNIRCTVCKHCHRSHRLEYWQKYDRLFATKPPTKEEWTMLISDKKTMKQPCLLDVKEEKKDETSSSSSSDTQ